ncbi:MAG: ABC transporter permease [Syntrophomonadaceae bacterium]|nr:ABC transporter permease [Syntrophomonadaceae bacterium]
MKAGLEVRRTINLKSFEWLWETQLGISVLSLGLSVLLLLIMSLMFGAQPLHVLISLFEGALKGQRSLVSTLSEMAVITLAGLAVLLPIRAGFFNIGGQGQIEIGALAAVVVATNLQGSPAVVILTALLTAIVAGALIVVVPLVLKIKRGASEVTTTIMMNFACIQLVFAMITGALKDPASFYGSTHTIQESFRLPVFPQALGTHAGVLLAIAIAILVYWLMSRTVFGMHLKAVGSNPTAARAAGISVNKVLICSVLLGAGLAGLAGGIQAMGVTYKVAEGWSKTWGFTGIPVAFLGGNGLGIIPVAFLLAIMETGARYMQAMTGVPSALVYVFKGIPVLVFICLTARRGLYHKKRNSD